nr:hypothetical protein [Cryptosporangium phraense]
MFAAFDEDFLGQGEDLGWDQRRMSVFHVDVAEGDRADVGQIREDIDDGLVAPGPPAASSHAAAVEIRGNRPGAAPFSRVLLEYVRNVWGFCGDRGQALGRLIDDVPLWWSTQRPLASAGLTFHPVDDPINDHLAFELGEDPEHLDEHSARWSGRVEGLGGRSEGDAGGGELVQEPDQVADSAAESVDAVDEQDVELAGLGVGDRALEVAAVEGSARAVVGVFGDDGPAVLRRGVGVELGVLGFDGERLVLFIGGATGVGGDPLMGDRQRQGRRPCRA